MSLLDRVSRGIVVAPHADDDVLGCGGLMAKLSRTGADLHVVFMTVDGFHHYGLSSIVSFGERLAEIEQVAAFLAFSWEIFFPDQDMIERLDTVPKRDLVDRFETLFNDRRPELLLRRAMSTTTRTTGVPSRQPLRQLVQSHPYSGSGSSLTC